MVKVSIVVPIYNTEKYLDKCLNSLVKQTLEDIEIILIDDGSKDKSKDIVNKYLDKYGDKIKYIYQENSGQAVARNKGIKMAQGEYIAFVDSDDYVEKEAYEILWNEANKKGYDILCFNLYEDVSGEIRYPRKYNTESEDVVKKYILNEASPCNKIIKREVLIRNNINFLEGRIYEDFAVIPTIAKYTEKIGYVNEHLYYYCIHENSTMHQPKFNKKLLDIYYVMEHLYKNFGNSKYITELEFLYIEHLLHGASLRFLIFDEGIREIEKIAGIMKDKFPKWRKNEYFKRQSIKYKIICNLLYYKKAKLVKKLLKIGR